MSSALFPSLVTYHKMLAGLASLGGLLLNQQSGQSIKVEDKIDLFRFWVLEDGVHTDELRRLWHHYDIRRKLFVRCKVS